MANLWSSLRGRSEKRFGVNDYAELFSYGGRTYPLIGTSASREAEEIENNFLAYIHGTYKTDGLVFAAIEARRLVFSMARFMWQRERQGELGELFSTPALEILRRPWPNGASNDLLSRMEQDVSLAGNFYAVREGRRLRRLRPDWVQIILTDAPEEAVASDIAGYLYTPGGAQSTAKPVTYSVEEVAHWAPIPDPEAQYRGMSWLTPVLKEVQGDQLATEHKVRFFKNAATPNIAVSLKESVTKEQFREFVQAMDAAHRGVENAYKTLYLGGGADVTVVGSDLRQLDFKATQGAGETRIAVASRVPAVLLGISEGLQGSGLNAGNFKPAKRAWQDGFLHPQWMSACGALATIVDEPADGVLSYDARHIPFLRDDQTDVAEIQAKEATALRALLDAGYQPDAAVAYIKSADINRLRGSHSGLFSVQLQPPGTMAPQTDDDAPVDTTDSEDE